MPVFDAASPAPEHPDADNALEGPPRRLTLHLSLHRHPEQASWSAELQVPGATAPLAFAGLPELIAFLARLDTPARQRGLR
jgi:hypothetical protein